MTTLGERIREARLAHTPPWSQQQLADALSRARWGEPGACPRHEVYRWETGRRRPTIWLPYLEKVLGLDLSGVPAPLVTDTVGSAMALGRRDVDRRAFLSVAAAASLNVLGLTDTAAITRRVNQTGPIRVGTGEVGAIHAMTRALGDAASELGGGHARHLAVRYLIEDVQPWLDGTYTDRVARELFAATSELVHLAGWMARDEGNHGLAQQYYIHSYRLAAEAGHNELAATALRGLAEQAIDLGHIATAVRLAEACAHQGRTLDNPKAQAYYATTHARAAAADADRTTAASQLATATTAIERAPVLPGQSWASHYSAGRWAHEAGMIRATMGDLAAAEEHLHVALDIHGIDRKRTRAMVLADLGQVQLKLGATDQALATWHTFLDTADGVRSVRINDSAIQIAARLQRIPDTAAANHLRERLAARESAG